MIASDTILKGEIILEYDLYVQLGLLAWTVIGFIIGSCCFLRKGGALYPKMVTMGIGCAMLGRLYNVAALLAGVHTRTEFNVGLLGVTGSILFLYAANYGQIDSLTDDGSRENRKYRRLAWLAPLADLLLFLPVLTARTNIETKAVCGAVTFFAMLASYYHLKHLIIPDVLCGIARSIRGYNIIALIYCAASVFEFTAYVCDWMFPLHVAYTIGGLCLVLITPVLKKGVRSWTI